MGKDAEALRDLLDELEAAKITRWQSDGPVTDLERRIDRVLAELAALRADVRALTLSMNRGRGSRPMHGRPRGLGR